MEEDNIIMKTFLIKNGKIIDGTGNPWFKGDLLIDEGKIKKIAPNIQNEDADEVIDASNLVVSPGFIDIHTHSDITILFSRGENVLTQGVTTHVVGNCGFSMVPPPNPDKLSKEDLKSAKSIIIFDISEDKDFKYLTKIGEEIKKFLDSKNYESVIKNGTIITDAKLLPDEN